MATPRTFKVRDKTTNRVFTIREKAVAEPEIAPREEMPLAVRERAIDSPVIPRRGFLERTRGFLETAKTKEKELAPITGQVVGGLGGGVLGGFLGGPKGAAALSAVGGTVGRGLGELERVAGGRRPLREAIGTGFAGAIGKGIAQFSTLNIEERKTFGKEVLKTGAIEAAFAPLGFGASKVFKFVGRGIGKGLLGARVAARGFERGWKRILNPEFYKGRVPKLIAQKMSTFFNRLTDVTGKTVSRVIKGKKGTIDITEIKNNVRQLLPKGGDPADLLELTASKSQKNLIKEITDEILTLRGNRRTVNSLWNLRRKIDKTIFSKRWTNDAQTYLHRVRESLNNPIKSSGDDVAEAFGRYSLVKEAESDLGSKFQAITGKNQEIYARKLESFISNLLSTNKDESIRLLRDLDDLLGVDDKIIEELLDLAASEAIEKKIGLGVFQETLIGMIGGRKTLAGIGAITQKPALGLLKATTGRLLPTLTTETAGE